MSYEDLSGRAAMEEGCYRQFFVVAGGMPAKKTGKSGHGGPHNQAESQDGAARGQGTSGTALRPAIQNGIANLNSGSQLMTYRTR
jgi:hypothetical protein